MHCLCRWVHFSWNLIPVTLARAAATLLRTQCTKQSAGRPHAEHALDVRSLPSLHILDHI